MVSTSRTKTTSRSSKKIGSPKKKLKTSPTVDSYKGGIPLTQKHVLAHTILRRWTYCLPQWPKDFEKVDMDGEYIETGFTGLFAGYRGDNCGILRDTRQQDRLMPTLSNLLKIDSSELREAAINGIKKQKADLIKHKSLNSESIFSNLCKELDAELKTVQKYNPKKIERDFQNKVYV